MKMYENRNKKKRATLCSYCGGEGHLWIACPHPKTHVFQINSGMSLDKSIFKGNSLNWATKKSSTGDLEVCDDLLIKNAIETNSKQRLRSANKIGKAQRRCGFCGSPSHNRRNCKIIKAFVEDLACANQNYRKHFYEEFVNHFGIAEGALLDISTGRDPTGGHLDTSIAIVQSIDWDRINLTMDIADWEYNGELTMSVITEGKVLKGTNPLQYWLSGDYLGNYPTSLRSLMRPLTRYDDAFQVLSVLSQSNNKPSEKWFLEGYDNGWEWLCKNKKLSDVGGVFAEVIEKWHPNTGSRGLSSRLKRYRKQS